jgi:hypothetical protein
MTGFLNQCVKQYLRLRMLRIEGYIRAPERAQDRWLRHLLDNARHTVYGRKFGFGEWRSWAEFAREVPIVEYDDLKPYIRQMMLGERDVLWPGEINWYSKSSGTTSDKSKYIPVPYDNLHGNHVAGSWDSLALLYHNNPDLDIFRHKNLILPGSFSAWPEHAQTQVGDVSALLIHHMPAIGRLFYVPDFETAMLSNFEEKIAKTAEMAARRDDIVMFGGVPTWILVLFRMILEQTGKSSMLDVWPKLQVYMHGGVGFEPYRQAFRALIPSDTFIYQEIYNASEGYFGAQCDPWHNDMLLLADNGVFYEFIPLEDWGSDHPRTVLLADVEVGKNYAIVISANNGLWRYAPGDTVMFTRRHPHCFRISGRTKQFINAFGEELMVGDAEKALADACRQYDAVVTDYTAGPVYFPNSRGRGGHEWVVEFGQKPVNVELFARVLDESLQRINSDYEAKRYKNLALAPLRLHAVPPGTFHRWMKSKGKFGVQNKVPRLANNRQYLDELLPYVGAVG